VRILLFGGSFDPPHRGHLALLKAAARRIKPDEIRIIPAHWAPLKGRPSASTSERLELVELGLIDELPRRWRKRARIDASEARSRRTVYTVQTLERLRERHPEAALHFVVGSDSAASFDRWKDPARLRALATWWTAKRPGAPAAPKAFWTLEDKMPEISSSDVRARLSRGEDCSDALAAAVAKRIVKRGLYGTRLADALRSRLKPGRFEHSQNVSRLAESLARRWGVDPAKARLAGLLHDCGREVPVDKMGTWALKRRLKVPALKETVANYPLLLHAYIGERVARARYGVSDPEILSAIRKHTLGDRRMSTFDRVLYVADSCSQDRDYPGVAALRKRAHEDLDAVFKACLRNKWAHARRSSGWLHPFTEIVWNSHRG